MDHTIWRVRTNLPTWKELLSGDTEDGGNFLRCWLRTCGQEDPLHVAVHLRPKSLGDPRPEMPFQVEFGKVRLRPGDIVDYHFAYSYDGAFFDPRELQPPELNAAGLRTGSRGPVHQASLTLLFQRNWDGNSPLPVLELENGHRGPTIATRNDTNLPGHSDLVSFFHSPEGWQIEEDMKPAEDASTPLYEVYEWSRPNFNGLSKATWQPTMHYHTKRSNTSAALEHPSENMPLS